MNTSHLNSNNRIVAARLVRVIDRYPSCREQSLEDTQQSIKSAASLFENDGSGAAWTSSVVADRIEKIRFTRDGVEQREYAIEILKELRKHLV